MHVEISSHSLGWWRQAPRASRWLSRRSGLNRTKGFSHLSWPVAKYWTIKRILACGLCVVLTFCKFSQFQFGWLQYLLSQIEYKFLGPSSLMSLCVWPFQTTLPLCEAYTSTPYILIFITIATYYSNDNNNLTASHNINNNNPRQQSQQR